MRLRVWLLLPLGLAACSTSPPAFCSGPTAFDYDPASPTADLTAFPDDFFTAADPASRTGLAVRVDPTNAPWLARVPQMQQSVYDALSSLDGFGTSAGIILRFSAGLGRVPSGSAASLSSKAVELFDLGPGGPTRVPFETQVIDDGAGVILWPMRPLRPKTRHAVIVTTAQKDAGGRCIAPSSTMRALLSGENVPEKLASLETEIHGALQALSLEPQDVSAAVVFTTQSIVEDSLAAAQDIAARTYAWKSGPTCTDDGSAPWRACRGVFTAEDYRKNGVVVDGTPQATYDLPVALWLPKTPGPWPVAIYGHGLGGSKQDGEFLANLAAPLGVATVAIDAPGHGEHPTAPPDVNENTAVLTFFGVDPATGTIDPLALRDHFREATYDKLQVLELLHDAPDVDGDGQPDLDESRIAYYGESLGGMMGCELLAMDGGIGLAGLTVPGGRIASIVQNAANFSLLVDLLQDPLDPGSIDRFFPVLQATVDKGDPVNWAPYVLAHRLPSRGATPPNLLVAEVIGDATMANVSTQALARALGIPQMPPVIEPMDLVPVLESAPAQGNLDGTTAALFQFDRVSSGSGVVPASHDNIVTSPENVAQVREFLQTWLAGGPPEIIDPYQALNTPPLGP